MAVDVRLPTRHVSLVDEPGWPDAPAGRSVLVLADAPSKLERTVVRDWIARHRPSDVTVDVLFLAPSRRRGRRRTDPAVAGRLQRGDNPWVFPIRVIWRAAAHDGRRSASWVDVLKLGDPRDPDPIRQHVIAWLDPSNLTLAVGEGAGAAELQSAHAETVEITSLVDFVTRKAHLALERAERSLRGNRYKVPKFVKEEILSRGDFRDGVLEQAARQGMSPELAFARARYYLGEIAASHSPFLIDLIANTIHWIYRQGYGSIIYDVEAVRHIAALGQDHPIVFLPSHRSNLDRLSLQYLLWENDLPPNHTAAGINMNFFPVGPLIRRTGAFFIRRSFRDNHLYKYVLRSYLDYLVERRFPLEWYIEGGRSRSGKFLPPKYGMLGWVVESIHRHKADDLYLIPTSITYDQIMDVADYASEARGGAKEKESFGWVVKKYRSLRRRYGNIHIRFAEPMSVNKEVPPGDDDTVSIELQKLAFEVLYRIGQVTPITPTAVVSIALLSARGTALGPAGIVARAREIDRYVETMGLPTTEPLHLERSSEVKRTLGQLAEHGSVTTTHSPTGDVYHLAGDQSLQAAYYRNTVVHFFVPGAITEMAVLAADTSRPESVLAEANRLRDLLKFEFFFPEREAFHTQIEGELSLMSPDWEADLADNPESLLGKAPLLRAHWTVLPFLEAYQIVADHLIAQTGDIDRKAFVASCLELGHRYRLEGRVGADESVSQVLFGSAFDLAVNRGLDDASTVEQRKAWAAEIAGARAQAERVAAIAESRLSET